MQHGRRLDGIVAVSFATGEKKAMRHSTGGQRSGKVPGGSHSNATQQCERQPVEGSAHLLGRGEEGSLSLSLRTREPGNSDSLLLQKRILLNDSLLERNLLLVGLSARSLHQLSKLTQCRRVHLLRRKGA